MAKIPIAVGTCALCLAKNVALQVSHVIPAWAYKRLRDLHPGQNPNPVRVTQGRALQTSRQVSEHLLCRACEQRFGLEDDYVSRLAFKNASVLALGCVGARLSTGGAQFAAPGSLDAARLAYFAASVVWRGDAASSVPECSLGAHAEPFRLYLNGQKPFPRTATVSLGVLRDDEVQWEQVAELISLPQSQHKGQEDSHEFALCGLYFTVLTGNYSPATCLAGPSPLVELVSRSEFLRWLAPGLQGLEFIGRQPVVHGKT